MKHCSLVPLALVLALTAPALTQEPPKAGARASAPEIGPVPLAIDFNVPTTQLWPEPSLHRLRNVAAADVAKAIIDLAKAKKMTVSVVAEPVSNSLLVAGDPAVVKQLDAIIAKIDKPPQAYQIDMMVLEVKPEFAEHVGLAAKGSGKPEIGWVLTEREHRMLTLLGFREAKASGDLVSVLSRPQLLVTENKTGYVQIGCPGSQSVSVNKVQYAVPPPQATTECVTARITPRSTPQGTAVDMTISVAWSNGATEMKNMALIPDDGASVWRMQKAGEKSEYLYIVKVSKVEK